MRPSIHDVARLAGVSTSTVSRALSGARPVKPELLTRVREAASSLGYRPDAIGQSLRTRKTGTLGLIICDITNPFFPALVQEVEKACREAGVLLLLADAQNDPEIESDAIDLFLAKRIDALLCSPSHRFLSQHSMREAAARVPTIQIDRVVDPSIGYVRVDQRAGIAQILDHLRRAGRKHVAFVGSDPATVSTTWERQEAFIDLVTDVDEAASHHVLVGDFTVEWGRKAAREAMAAWPETDAIVCGNDLIGFGVLDELAAIGINCPRQVALASFDDSLIARATRPALTSVRQPIAQMAEEGVAYALAAIADPGSRPAQVLMPELVIRDSSGGA